MPPTTTWEDTVKNAMTQIGNESEQAAVNPEPLKPPAPRGARRGSPTREAEKTEEEEIRSWWEHKEVIELLQKEPKAFIEPEGPKAYDTDAADKFLPTPGFVTDFVNTMRGSEAPTLFLEWGALWAISTVLTRQAWFKWYPKRLWPNLYLIYVAPPGLCKKSVSMDVAKELLSNLWKFMPNASEGYQKSFKFITNKATPDALGSMLKPETRVFFPPNSSKALVITRGSQITITVSELATFLGKQQYNTGLVNTITDLYDCKDSDSFTTLARGTEPAKEIYVTFAGAITPVGLERSIPEEALGGGLISRSVIVYQEYPSKIVPIPYQIEGYPKPEDILPKLAWIATHAKGEYYLSKEAMEAYTTWYREWKGILIANIDTHREDETRKDIILLKLAMLFRIQEYREGKEISLENFQQALDLLEYTLAKAPGATAAIGASDYMQALERVKSRISARHTIGRAELQRSLSKYHDADMITRVINDLSMQGFIRIEFGGQICERSTCSGKEVYTFCA